MRLHQLNRDSHEIPAVLRLVQDAFAFMESRIDPPSSMHRMSAASIAEHCERGEVWVFDDPPVACVFFSERDERLYIGKMAVSEDMRGRGLARRFIELAQERAALRGFSTLELESRIELSEVHAFFRHQGFEKTGEGTHAGYDRPTYITMRRECSD